jgi:hypothetical protein
VANHAVCGIDRLIRRDAGGAENYAPERRRHHPIRKILRQALDRRARHGVLIQAFRVTPDNLCHRTPPFRQAAVQPVGYGRDMLPQAALRQQRGAEQEAEKTRKPKRGHNGKSQDDANRNQTVSPRRVVQLAVKPTNESTYPNHRMTYEAVQNLRVTKRCLQQQRGQDELEMNDNRS